MTTMFSPSEGNSPVGRLVQGNPLEAQTKNMAGAPLVTKAGQPTQRYFVAVAYAKTDPAFAALRDAIMQEARASFPRLFDAQGNCLHPRFSFKIMDGDGIDDNGKRNAEKDGFAGHWVVKFTTSFPPKCYHAGHYQPHEQITDPREIPRGYYVRVMGSVQGNGDDAKPGVFVNVAALEIVAQGPLIVGGPDVAAGFAPAPALPPGAQALPSAQTAVTPHPSFLTPGAAPSVAPGSPSLGAAPSAPSAPTTSPSRQMTPKAAGATFEQFIAQGWTEAQMRQQGYLI